ncbi:hypothetical protein [Dyadobacter psychrotolerans]|uniref:Uncharacterized protein n=1 Tax=Dyadobacter psychrotolerans TaxID=2541721 RepID=A0A4R5DC49_9BACT|nr:hypothetical protein [Dyadobacter psychrotolerans]TDE11296.1 hypothetical protein E0F88_25630 [Dyadobacter psychrotolerans]
MKISKELIEKYYEGKCSSHEMAMVEDWLLSDETEQETFLPEHADKEKIKADMWAEVASVLPSQSGSKAEAKFRILNLRWAVAATLLMAVSAFVFLKLNEKISAASPVVSSVNSSQSDNTEIREDDYTISLGPMSNVQINSATGLIDFCGTLRISPKRDVKLTFKDDCSNKNGGTEKISFKKGQTYIALNYRNQKNNEVIVLDENRMMGLPTVVKRQIMDQFNI